MIDVLNLEDGSRWVEDQIRYGLRSAWGEEEWAVTVVVEATLIMPQDRLGPRAQVKAVAFKEGNGCAVVSFHITGELNRDALWEAGRESADALKKTLPDFGDI